MAKPKGATRDAIEVAHEIGVPVGEMLAFLAEPPGPERPLREYMASVWAGKIRGKPSGKQPTPCHWRAFRTALDNFNRGTDLIPW